MAGPRPGALLGRQRAVALTALLVVAALAWVYLWLEAARMEALPMATLAGAAAPWRPGSLALVFVMWAVMMVGMMLPSAAPAILLYGAMVRSRQEGARRGAPVWVFAGGYLAVWTLFSVLATVLQAGLQSGGLLDPMMSSASVWLSAAVLAVAGLYQWLPLKDGCLHHCRNPMQLFLFRWRAGASGAWRMGAEHGTYCVGCCWALMLVLFAAGVMNLLWVALIAALVFAEKLLPGGAWLGRVAGVGMLAGALALVAG